MPYFNTTAVDTGHSRVVGSPSSGDTTPTPSNPTTGTEPFTPNTHMTPSPHYPEARRGRRPPGPPHIWEDANRATTAQRMAAAPTMLARSLHDANNIERRAALSSEEPKPGTAPAPASRSAAAAAAAAIADLGVDASDWEAALADLHLAEAATIPQHGRTVSDVPVYSHGQAGGQTGVGFARQLSGTAIQADAVGQAARPRQLSIWATYGSNTNDNNNNSDNSSANHSGIRPISCRADLFTGAGSLPSHHRSRASSETISSTTSAAMYAPQPQRRFASQPDHPFPDGIPFRIGEESQYARQNNSAAVHHHHHHHLPPPPPAFRLQPRHQGFMPMHAVRAASGSSSSSRERQPHSMPFHMPGIAASQASVSTVPATGPISGSHILPPPPPPPLPPLPPPRFSERYHGMHTESNASAEHLAPEQNASLWITNLPPDITHHELLGQIRNVGRVWCCFINGPDGAKHATAAAKIVFFQPRAAQALLRASLLGDGMRIRGYAARITQNRIKTPENRARGGDDSRVLIVTGQAYFVNETTLMRYFEQRFVFQLDEVAELVRARGRAVVEFRFGSFRCQAQMGKISLDKDRPVGFEKAEFGQDPCEVGDKTSSYEIALMRIQGVGL